MKLSDEELEVLCKKNEKMIQKPRPEHLDKEDWLMAIRAYGNMLGAYPEIDGCEFCGDRIDTLKCWYCIVSIIANSR